MTVLSWNGRGLNIPQKRFSTLDILKRKRADVALLQETHLLDSEVTKMNNKYFNVVASSSNFKKNRGVVILFNRAFQCTIAGSDRDMEGRVAYVKTITNGLKIAFFSIYAPNTYNADFYAYLTNSMLELSDYYLVIGGDFNAVWSHVSDRTSINESSDQRQASAALQQWASDCSVVDAWRLKYPLSREFTCFSSRHQTFSRIDYIIVSTPLTGKIQYITICPTSMSDHKIIIGSLKISSIYKRAARWRFNISLLQNEIFVNEMKQHIDDFILTNESSVSDPCILWETLKGAIRNKTIAFASNLHKTRNKKIHKLEEDITSVENSMVQNITPELVLQRELLYKELNNQLMYKANFLIHRSRQNFYLNSAQPSHLLALRLKQCEKLASINAVKSANGTIHTDPVEINSTFAAFYSSLYTSEINFKNDSCFNFLNSVQLHQLSDQECISLETPLSLSELQKALQTMNSGKSPGLDGLPPEFFTVFWSQLGPLLLNMFLSTIKKGYLSKNMNIAIITLILKKGKDPLECSNYRPLSLLNTDIKLFAKVLSSRLEPFIQQLVNKDQTGFIKNRFASDNIRRLLHIIYSGGHTSSAILSLDAEKAFDRLEWEYLWTVLDRMGFGDTFIRMVKILYSNPTAMVLTGSTFSKQFSISRSSRQGCPLSPLLFALSLEPVAQAIRQSTHQPIKIHSTTHSISLYADDILLYMQDVEQSLPIILNIFDSFSKISGYKVNWSKSALLSLNDKLSSISFLNIPVVTSLKYLGVSIFPSLAQIINVNYQAAYTEIEKDLIRWNNLQLTFHSRISIIKMNVLPRVNFVSSMLQLPPPKGYWRRIHSLTCNFIWGKKKTKVKFSTLQQHKDQGGLGVPNFQWYYWSFTVRSISKWLDPNSEVSWREMEQNIVKPHRLEDLIYSNIPTGKLTNQFGPIITETLSIWRQIENHCKINVKWHSQSPIFYNFNLKISNRPIIFTQWSDKGLHSFNDVYSSIGLLSFQDLQKKFNLPATSFFFYLQLRTAMKTYGVPWATELPTHPLHNVLTKPGRVVSLIYSYLCKSLEIPFSRENQWLSDLPANTIINWNEIWHNIHLASRNPNHQMIHYKFVYRAYFYPQLLHKIKIVPSPLCTLCSQNAQGTYLHMIWECPGVAALWKEVAQTLSEILNINIPYSIKTLLLNDSSDLELSVKQKRVWLAGLTAAKRLIAMRWKNPHPFTKQKWLIDFLDITNMEHCIASTHRAKEDNIKLWKDTEQKIKNWLQGL